MPEPGAMDLERARHARGRCPPPADATHRSGGHRAAVGRPAERGPAAPPGPRAVDRRDSSSRSRSACSRSSEDLAATRLVIGALEIRTVPACPGPTATPSPTRWESRSPRGLACRRRVPDPVARRFRRAGHGPDVPDAVREPFGPPRVGRSLAARARGSAPWTLVLLELPGGRVRLQARRRTGHGARGRGRRTPRLLARRATRLVLGRADDQTYSVAGNVLVWDAGDEVALRMETALSLREAIALAETVG